jgi:ssDNA-binding Zn-finger/Zn-ribbon topoisomerase 1
MMLIKEPRQDRVVVRVTNKEKMQIYRESAAVKYELFWLFGIMVILSMLLGVFFEFFRSAITVLIFDWIENGQWLLVLSVFVLPIILVIIVMWFGRECWIVLAVTGVLRKHAFDNQVEYKFTNCPSCGYSVVELPANICPECGKSIVVDLITEMQ